MCARRPPRWHGRARAKPPPRRCRHSLSCPPPCQGGEAHLAKNGLKLHAAFKLSQLLEVLVRHGHVSEETAGKVRRPGAVL
jgi:hypothetical protein